MNMKRSLSYSRTRLACYVSFIVQAIVNNLAPLLFVTFQREFFISLERVSALIAINFVTQMTIDALAMKYAARIGIRRLVISCEVCAALGLMGLAIFPRVFSNPFVGLCAATILSATGGGLIEVLISPILEAIPSGNKAASMSFLHSFYCWGQAAVALLSALFFWRFSRDAWPALPVIGALVPIAALVLFIRAPFCSLPGDAAPIPLRRLVAHRLVPPLFLLMLASGASEISMAQWASLFAETGLGISKTLGDILGPCAFALAMGVVRAWYGTRGTRVDITRALFISAVACVACYLAATLAHNPIAALVGCACTGFTVALMWPGTLSFAARRMPEGGTALFALLALAGDTGATLGPLLVGRVAGAVDRGILSRFAAWFAVSRPEQSGIKLGLLTAIIFPVLLAVIINGMRRKRPGDSA